MGAEQSAVLRAKLLRVWGIGPETADSILLYALEKPSFVVDAYTRRVFSRLGVVDEDISYDELKRFFEDCLPKDTSLHNEFHALIVVLAKSVCKPKPECNACPIKKLCSHFS